MEHSKSYYYDQAVFEFVVKHRALPENVQVARAIVEGNQQIIEKCISNGTFTQNHFDEILRDEELLGKYTKMVEALDKGMDENFLLLFNDIKDKPDTHCGWLAFYNQHLEAFLNMELVRKSSTDYYIQEYQEGN